MRKKELILKISAWATGLLALTQCASVQEMEIPVPAEGSFEIFATPEDTRTVNEGQSTRWVKGDRFNLFHAVAGATSYVADGAFTVDDIQTGHATGSVKSLSNKNYDWYMVYPYNASASSPKAVPVTIGAASGQAQVQAGADSQAHLAGTNVPLSGRVKGVAADDIPVLSVAPAVSVIAVNVTNPGEGDVRVSEVRFQAPEAIVGSFKVNVTGKSPVFTTVEASEEASLTVQGGALLKKEESGVFYMVIKPFTAAAGSTLTLTVNEEVHTVTLDRAVSFSAGKIKTLNVTLDPSEPQQGTYFFKKVSAFKPGRKYILIAEEVDSEESMVLRMAQAIPEGTTSGRLYCEDVEEEDGVITLSSLENAFTFYEGENGTLIRQADGRYLYNNSSSNANLFTGTEPTAVYCWTISFDNQGLALITNRQQRQLKYNETVRAFQARKSSESGLFVRLYELQNGDDAIEEFIQNTTPGVYAYQGSDWLYEEGSKQLSVRTGNGSVAFRIYEPSTYTVIQITGIPETIAENDCLDIRVARYVKQAATHFSNLSAQVVHVAAGKAWLMAGNGTGIIVCIQ